MSILVKVDNTERTLNGEKQAVLSHIYDLGMQENNFDKKEVKDSIHKIMMLWELNEIVPGKDYRWTITKEYACSLGKQANLRKDLESIYGEGYFNDKDGQTLDIEKLIGLNAVLNIEEKKGKDNKNYPYIAGLAPLPNGQAKIAVTLKRDYCPDWIMKKISNQYNNNPTGGGQDINPWDDEKPF